jgi:hypothetical protein
MAHIGVNDKNYIEIFDQNHVIRLSYIQAKALFKEFERLMKYLEKKERKK